MKHRCRIRAMSFAQSQGVRTTWYLPPFPFSLPQILLQQSKMQPRESAVIWMKGGITWCYGWYPRKPPAACCPPFFPLPWPWNLGGMPPLLSKPPSFACFSVIGHPMLQSTSGWQFVVRAGQLQRLYWLPCPNFPTFFMYLPPGVSSPLLTMYTLQKLLLAAVSVVNWIRKV